MNKRVCNDWAVASACAAVAAAERAVLDAIGGWDEFSNPPHSLWLAKRELKIARARLAELEAR